jgi:major vault protein
VEEETRKSLQKSVNMAFEIQTRSQEAAAQHQAMRLQQEADGMIQRLEIQSEIQNEKVNKNFWELKAENEGVRSTGLAIANAKAKAEADLIKAQTEVDQAQFQVDSQRIRETTELELIEQQYKDEIKLEEEKLELEIDSKRKLIEVEIEQFKVTVDAIKPETIVAMAKAGPETQAKLLKGLGLQGYMIVDGKHTVNLMGAANGMLGKQ